MIRRAAAGPPREMRLLLAVGETYTVNSNIDMEAFWTT